MKLTIELNEKDEERQTLNAHMKGPDLAMCIWNLEQLIRKYNKMDKLPENFVEEFFIIIENDIGRVEEYTY